MFFFAFFSFLTAFVVAKNFPSTAMTQEESASPAAVQKRPAVSQAALDATLQRAVEDSMKGLQGAVVVLDVDSGRVLAQHRLDTAARTLAAPGSAIKPFTLLALLESGKVKPEEGLQCPIELRIGKRRLNCSHPRVVEPMQASTALAYSCNFYFAQMALRLTNDELMRVLARAGLNVPTGLAPNEVYGTLRAPSNNEQRQLLALGLEIIRVTPLGLAAAYRKLALLRKQSGKMRPAQEAVFAGLEASATYGMGTLAQTPGLQVAGKTGTASAEGVWTHAWFAGYAPAKAPEIVVVVYLVQGRGGLDAAPVAGKIFAAYAAAQNSR